MSIEWNLSDAAVSVSVTNFKNKKSLRRPCVDIPRPRKAQPPSRLSTEPNVNQCQLCLHKLSIHSGLGLFGHALKGCIHASILNVNYGHCLVKCWSCA